MTRVLLVAAALPPRDALVEALARLDPAAVTVDLAVVRSRAQDTAGLPVREVHPMRRPRAALRRRLPRGAVSPRWWWQAYQAVAGRVVGRRGDLPLKAWYGARWDPWVTRAAAEADVIAALDKHAVYTVWKLARRHRGARAVLGVDAAVRALTI